jgi:hypothetical protein
MSEDADTVNYKYLHDRRFEIRVQVRMNRHYQQRRQAAMEFREGLVKVCSLIAGSVALANVTDPQIIKAAAAVVFAGTAAALVFGWGNKARDAAKRFVDWVALERDIDATGERTFTEADLDAWQARCTAIESGEPAPNRRLLNACHMLACESLGSSTDKHPGKATWQRLPPVIIP